MNSEESPLLSAGRSWFQRRSLLFKLLGIGFLCLLLLIPLAMVRSTLHERLWRYNQAVESVTTTWGPRQQLFGPVLVIPYTYTIEVVERSTVRGFEKVEQKTRTVAGNACFLPESLQVVGELEPAVRKRGIYNVHLYSASVNITGRFDHPDLSFPDLADFVPQWENARVCFSVSDLRGVRDTIPFMWNGSAVPTEPGVRLPGFTTGLHAPVEISPETDAADFSLDLMLNGSGRFSVVPAGGQTVVRIGSPWAHPGFDGAYLPVDREVSDDGFNAEWQVSYLGRGFPQRWTDHEDGTPMSEAGIQASAFGVTLLDGITPYRTVERAIKYGVLFIMLAFATFFLFEVTSRVRLNALNYILVGVALCLFYLGLLALSEFISFALAYGISASASVMLIGLYSGSVLRRRSRAFVVSSMLGGVYAYLYFVVQMEDYALLAGTGALFAVLAAIMFFTRKIDEARGSAQEEANTA